MNDLQSLAYEGAAAVYALGWIALLIAPARLKFCWIFARSCAVVLALTYLGLLLSNDPFHSLPQFLLTNRENTELQLLAIGCFSLFIGSWQVEDAPQHGIPHAALLPCLILTAVAGPIGFALHIGLRDFFKWRRRNWQRQAS